MKALEFYAAFPIVSCASCRGGYEEDGRLPPCDETGVCAYTKREEEPPTERLDGYGKLAMELWQEKELFQDWALVEWKLSLLSAEERYIVQTLLRTIEAKAYELEIKKPKTGGMF